MSKKLIRTKFYRSKLQADPDIQSKNYNNYTIFSLKLWTHLWAKDFLGNDILIKDVEVEKDDNILIALSFLTGNNEPVALSRDVYTPLSKKIKNFDINKYNWFPIYSHKYDTNLDNGTVIPKIWVKQMLNFINVNPTYQPYISPDGLLINLSQNPDYIGLMSLLIISIKDKLIEMYKIGFILKPDSSLVSDWELVPHDIKGGNRNYLSIDLDQDVEWNNQSIKTVNYLLKYNEGRDIPYDNLLYKFNLNINSKILGRYTYMTDFLISRMKGDTELEFPFFFMDKGEGQIILDRHEIAVTLRKEGLTIDDFIFDDNGIIFPQGGRNYVTAERYIDLIENYFINRKHGVSVEIGFLKAARIEEFDNVKEGIIYRTNDQERPFTASFIN